MLLKGFTTLLLAVGFMQTVIAAPKLQMHVFDQDEQQAESTNSSGLTMHIFEHGQQPVSEAQYAKPRQYQQKTPTKEPVLAYEFAEAYIKAGYRHDELYWNKAGRNNQPNILSELTWENLQIATISAGSSLFLNKNWLVNFDLTYGRIFDGEVQDSDYFGDNRTLEFSRSNNGADEGDVYDLSISTGYRYFPSKKVELRPLLGLSYHAQNLKMVDAVQTISTPGITPPLGPFPGLDSTYDSTWFGPWLGIDSFFTFSNKFKLGLGFEYHYAFYDSTADWNLRSDRAHPESFTMEAKGSGLIGHIEGQYLLNPQLSIDLSIDYQDWSADKDGEQVIYWADGTDTKLKFNEVHWDSYSINVGVNLKL